MSSAKITPKHVERTAYVHIRQSTLSQVQDNQESRRRQYELADRARSLGWGRVEVVDEDLGRSGSGRVERPGFQRLVSAVCLEEVGAVFALEASRLARNNRDWHHLVDLCGLTSTLIIDAEGVYDPHHFNDRLLLGLKGTMSEWELGVMRQRSLVALREKAERGELHTMLPVGFLRTRDDRCELDPDRRIRTSISLVFEKFEELGSIRQVLLWFRQEGVELPVVEYGSFGRAAVWKLPVYNSVRSILTNPVYAGAYAYGRTRTERTRGVFPGGRTKEAHQLTRRIEARVIAEFGQDGHRRDCRDAPQTHQSLSRGALRPGPESLVHLGFESGGPLHGCDHCVHVLLKARLLDRQIESLLLQPAKVCLRPTGPAAIDTAVTEQKGSQTLSGLEFECLHILARTGQIAHRFLVRSRDPHRGEFPGPVQPRQRQRVSAIRLDPAGRLARNEPRRHDLAVVAGAGDFAVHAVAAGTRFVGETQCLSVRALQSMDEFLHRAAPVQDDAPVLGICPARPRDRGCDRILVNVQPHVGPVVSH